MAEQVAVDVAVDCGRPEELSMVERIERLQPELQLLRFRPPEGFQQRDIRIEHSRPVERPAGGRARSAQGIRSESRSVEILLPVSWIVVQIQRTPDAAGKM